MAPHAIVVCLFQNDRTDVGANTWLRGGKVMTPDDPGLPDRIVKVGYLVTKNGAGMRDNVLATWPPSVLRAMKRSYLIALLRDRLLHDAAPSMRANTPQGDDAVIDRKFVRSLELLREVAGNRRLIFYLIGGPDGTRRSSPSQMDALVTTFALEHGIPVLSNNQDFSEKDFFQLDSHFTRQGNVKAAKYLYQALSQLGL